MQQLNAHPDLGGDETEAALINRAYAVLSNSDKRKEYNCDLEAMRRAAVNPGTPLYESPADRIRDGRSSLAGDSHSEVMMCWIANFIKE